MILGYLLPNDDIYTIKGEYIGKFALEDDEKIIMRSKNIEIGFAKYSWDNNFDLESGLDAGLGNVIRTNKRIIYKREIDPMSSNRFWNFPPVGVVEMWKAKKLKKEGVQEYFEFKFEEIRGYVEWNFPIFSSFNGYGLYIISIDKSDGMIKKEYYKIGFKKRYKILDDKKIFKKKLSKDNLKQMRLAEKAYKRKEVSKKRT